MFRKEVLCSVGDEKRDSIVNNETENMNHDHDTEFCREHSNTSCLNIHKPPPPDTHDIYISRAENWKVVLNIGGEKHEVLWNILERHPRSRLGLLASASTTDQVDRNITI